MKSISLSKILTISIFAILFLLLIAYRYYSKLEIEAKITAGIYASASNSMRELMFVSKGMDNGEIRKGCFVHERIEEILSNIDWCLDNRYPICENYANEVTPKELLENYRRVKSNPRAFSGCN